MPRSKQDGLTTRENQIMDVIWQLDEASVEDIRVRLSTALADSTVRTLLAVMEEKGYVEFYKRSKAKIYRARVQRKDAQKSAIKQMIERLFQGSADLLLARLVEDEELSLEEIERLCAQVKSRKKDANE
jgi:predicted transcriptional regulator